MSSTQERGPLIGTVIALNDSPSTKKIDFVLKDELFFSLETWLWLAVIMSLPLVLKLPSHFKSHGYAAQG